MTTIDIRHGDCLAVMRSMPSESVHAVITDPPYGLSNLQPSAITHAIARWNDGDRDLVPTGKGFMGREWDGFVPPPAVWDEVMRVLVPGGHLAVFAGTRTVDIMGLSIRLAGFEMRDSIAAWLYGSGFPKSHDVSKAIEKSKVTGDVSLVVRGCAWIADECDRLDVSRRALDEAAGTSDMGGWWASRLPHRCALPTAEQWARIEHLVGAPPAWLAPVILPANATGEAWGRREVVGSQSVPIGHAFAGATYGGDSAARTVNLTAPATDAAREWEGWGTALKPAFEPILLARKPLSGTVAANTQLYGAGGIHVDACRVATDEDCRRNARGGENGLNGEGTFKIRERRAEDQPERDGRWPTNVVLAHHPEDTEDECHPWCQVALLDEQSGNRPGFASQNDLRETPSAYFGADKTPGRRDGYNDSGGASRFFPTFRYQAKAPKRERPLVDGKGHPTVKPLGLMQWLVRLLVAEGGTLVDPFCGSGATGEAARNEGVNAILIDADEFSVALTKERLS